MGKAMRKLTPALRQSNTALVFVNQVRDNMDPYASQKRIYPGGHALKHWAAVVIELDKDKNAKDKFIYAEEEVVGVKMQAKIKKSKFTKPLKIAYFSYLFDSGIDNLAEIVDLGVAYDLIQKSGSYYKIEEQSIHGRDNMIEYLRNNLELIEQLKGLIYQKTGVQALVRSS
jgi:recombination protein RecA